MTFKFAANATSGSPICVSLPSFSVDTNLVIHQVRRMPLAISQDQLYFWTADWQASEERAEADFAAGHSQEFDNFMDLARDLLSE